MKRPAAADMKRPAAQTTAKGGFQNPEFVNFLEERTPSLLNREEKTCSTVFKYCFYCRSCTLCASQKGWRGRATYDTTEQQLQIRGLPVEKHGSFDRRQNLSEHALLPSQKHVVASMLRRGGPVSVQKALHELADKDAELPAETALSHFMHNYKKRSLTKEEKKELEPWSLSDLRNLAFLLPTLESEDAAAQPLVLVSSHLEDQDVSLIFTNVSLFSR